jgi:hypothetical protein
MFACHLSDFQTEVEILINLLLLETCYEFSIFLLAFRLLKEGKAPMQLSHYPHNYP